MRDLLVIAGQLGVPVISADQHAWITSGHQGHLGTPPDLVLPRALAFCVVVAGLVWWGREVNRPIAGETALGPPRPLRSEAVSKVRSAPLPGKVPPFRLLPPETPTTRHSPPPCRGVFWFDRATTCCR